VHEDPSRLAPTKRLLQPRLPEPRGEGVGSVGRRVLDRHPAEVRVPDFRSRQREGIAVVAALGDLRAAGHGVPRGVSPLDAGFQTHSRLLGEPSLIPNEYRIYANKSILYNKLPPSCDAAAG